MCCFWLRLPIPCLDRDAWDRWNRGRLQFAHLIDSQNGGFILNKFQYVACACNIDCNVTGGHGFNHQKQKNPLLLKGVFSTWEPCRVVTLNLHPEYVRLWGGALLFPLGIGGRVTVGLKVFFCRCLYNHVQRLFKIKGKVLHCLKDFRP